MSSRSMWQSIESDSLEWYFINEEHLSTQTLHALKEKFSFHDLDIGDLVSITERPKIYENEDYLSMTLHFPFYNKERHRIEISELHIYMGADWILTVSDAHLVLLEEMFHQAEIDSIFRRDLFLGGIAHTLYKILIHLYDACLVHLDIQRKRLTNIEDDIFDPNVIHDNIQDILIVKRNLIAIKRTLFPQKDVVASLGNISHTKIPKEMKKYFADVTDRSEKICDEINIYTETIEALHDANDSMMSRHTNAIMKILTTFSVVLLPLTLLAGMYGMNVHLPIETNPHAFWIVSSIMSVIALGLLGVFYWKKWM